MELLDEMPMEAHWRAAQANDPYAVKLLDDLEIEAVDPPMPLTGYTLLNEQLATIQDLLIVLLHRGDEKYQHKPVARPRNAMGERVNELRKKKKEQESEKTLQNGLSIFAPHLAE